MLMKAVRVCVFIYCIFDMHCVLYLEYMIVDLCPFALCALFGIHDCSICAAVFDG